MALKLGQMPDTDITVPSTGTPSGMDNPPSRPAADAGGDKQDETTKTRRRRRTKAEIEADKAKALAEAHAETVGEKVQGTQSSGSDDQNSGTPVSEEQAEAALTGGFDQHNPPWDKPIHETELKACRDKASVFFDFGWCQVHELSSLDRKLIFENDTFLIFQKV